MFAVTSVFLTLRTSLERRREDESAFHRRAHAANSGM
jgi:hypothetical protein